jgi:hypothetical protein
MFVSVVEAAARTIAMMVSRLTGVANQSKPMPGGAVPPAHPPNTKARDP